MSMFVNIVFIKLYHTMTVFIVSLENVFVVFYPSHYTVINWGKIPFRVTKNP